LPVYSFFELRFLSYSVGAQMTYLLPLERGRQLRALSRLPNDL